MQALSQERVEQERQRIANLKQQLQAKFAELQQLIDNERPVAAKPVLIDCYRIIKELKSDEFDETYRSFIAQIAKVKERLIKRENERKRIEEERLAQQRREEEKRQRRLDEERRRREEAERLRRQREAEAYEARKRAEAERAYALAAKRQQLAREVSRPKSEGDRFIDYLRMKGITRFYHFTERRNLASIRRHGGLYSWKYCLDNDIRIPHAGGDQWSRQLDRRHGLEDYVRLSFCSDHPMAYRHQQDDADLVLLEVKIDVAAFKDTQFSNMNAAANAVKHGATLDDLKRVNIFAVKQRYVSRQDDIFNEHQAECMVKTFIPAEYITNLDNPTSL